MRSQLVSSVGTLVFAASIALSEAQTVTNYVIDQFNTETTDELVNQNWGTAIPAITWTTNGSAKWVVPWTTTGDQIMVTRTLTNVVNLNNFNSLSFDIQFAATSATDGNGSYGALEIDWVPQVDGWPSTPNTPEGSVTFASGNTNWIHVVMPIAADSIAKLAAVNGIGFKIQQARTGSNLTGTTTFWLDNIVLSGFVASPVTGPPEILQVTTPQLWQRLELQITNVPNAGNPFDPDSIRLDGTFTMPSGKTLVVPAFWYQGYARSLSSGTEYDGVVGPPQWRLRFTPPETGVYTLSLAIATNDQPYGTATVTNFTVAPSAPPAHFGYVSVNTNREYFQTGDGQGLPLNGEDVCWPTSRDTYDYDDWFASMQNASENFARIWMSPWNFGIEDNLGTLTNYAQMPAWQLDYVFQLAEQKGIYLQLMLVWHGMFVTQPDYWGSGNSWPQNPYNLTNGGPCLTPNAFFTNAIAKSLFQKRLRYLVGRYGYSQNLLDWEFCNEIDNDYSFLNQNDVAAWHGAMGDWMRTNDPEHHLITTSLTYASEHPEIWKLPEMDFISEHSYNISSPATDLNSDAQTFMHTYLKPVMIGEYGTSWQGWNPVGDPYLRGFREGIWGGALGGSVGTAMAWWWQNIDSENDYSVYASLGTILQRTGWGHGAWTNIVFGTGQQTINGIGQRGAHESLLYLTAHDANFPADATNAIIPAQQGQSIALTAWPAGTYYAQWYDPATAAPMGRTQANLTKSSLTLSVPTFNVDLAGIVYPAPSLTAGISSNVLQFQLVSETGGQYLIQMSTNLSLWSPLLTVTNTTGILLTNVPVAPGNGPLFFRAAQVAE